MSADQTSTPPAPLLPRARALQARIAQQLNTPAALLVPAGVRQAVAELGELVADLAARMDHPPTNGAPK